MQKYRIYELAKIYNKGNDEIIAVLNKNNIEVKNRLNSVDEKAKEILDKAFASPSVKKNKRPPMRTVRFDQQGRPTGSKTAEVQKKSYSSYNTAVSKPVKTGMPEEAKKAEADKKAEKESLQRKNIINEGKKEGRQLPTGKMSVITHDGHMGEQIPHKEGQPARTERNDHPRKNNRPQGGYQQRGERSQGGNQRRGDRPQGGHQQRSDRFQGDRRPVGARRPVGDRRSGAAVKPAGGLDEQPLIPQARRDRPDKKKTKKDYERSRREKESGSLMARSLNQNKKKKHVAEKKATVYPTEIEVPESITVKELAEKLGREVSEIIKYLMLSGVMVTINQNLDHETVEIIAEEFGAKIIEAEAPAELAEYVPEADDERFLKPRPAVVTIMGHVDHGKTTLLDALRSTNVAMHEAGGITQRIGAYQIRYKNHKITFLDTPGHEAFTAMRMRGANSTDIAILVVAADDGVMPQTVEAINHAKAAGVEIIVAVNKIDKPSANIDKVKQELSEYELIPEDWGGSTIFCPVSAHTKEGIDNLLEMILLTAEVLELKANPDRNARGLVIEAQLDKGRGAVATVLVQKGTLHVGDPIACGSSYGKVRAMIDDKGRRVKEAKPSTPVEILGLNSVPSAGETFVACDSEKEAKAFSDTYISEEKNKLIEDTKAKMSLDDLFSQIQSGNMKELDIIVKADVQGSVEAVKQSLVKLSNEEVVVKVIHGGVGAINESDVILASASNAIIIGFNVRPDPVAKATADREGVDIRLYKVIYNAIEDVSAAMKGMLDPVFEEKVIGHAEIRQIFKASGVGNIAGSYVLDGFMERGCRVRISREGEQIFEGDLASLKRFKDDVKEVKTGYECGLVFDGFNDIQEFDIVEAYKMVEVPR